MAKSIFEILADLNTETSVPGYGDSISHTIPRRLFPTPEVFEDGDKLLAWAEENGYTHALIQQGLQKGLIDLRAKFKACRKNDTWTETYGQKNIDAHKWEITERPNAGTSKKINAAVMEVALKMAKAMIASGQPDTVAIMALSAAYGENDAKEILRLAKE